jgi:hypothetical protein
MEWMNGSRQNFLTEVWQKIATTTKNDYKMIYFLSLSEIGDQSLICSLGQTY